MLERGEVPCDDADDVGDGLDVRPLMKTDSQRWAEVVFHGRDQLRHVGQKDEARIGTVARAADAEAVAEA